MHRVMDCASLVQIQGSTPLWRFFAISPLVNLLVQPNGSIIIAIVIGGGTPHTISSCVPNLRAGWAMPAILNRLNKISQISFMAAFCHIIALHFGAQQ